MIGKTFGKYQIVGQLGRGGMGTVFKALDEVLDREVAIKVMNADLASSEMVDRFRTEAITLARLNHPDIATIYELFRSDSDLFMVMELVRGETLDRISDRMGPLPPEHAAGLIGKILTPLAHAHRAGIVHRDMKPANIMVTEHGGVKIMDFGVAHVRGAEHVDGYLMGTPAYMSPEQVLGREVDGRADLYSIGVIFYRLLTGALPFNADTTTGMVRKQVSEPPAPLRWHREGLPGWCETILHRALAKSNTDRFQTAEEFRETLRKVAGILTSDLTKAFSISLTHVDAGTSSSRQPSELERFGLTPVGLPALQMPSEAIAAPTVPIVSSVLKPPSGIGEDATIVLRTRRPALTASMFVIVASALTVVAISLRHPAIVSAPQGETMPALPIQNTAPSLPIQNTAPSSLDPMGRGTVAATPQNAPTPAAGRADAPAPPAGRATSARSPSAAPVTEAAGLTAGAANDPAPTAAVAGKASAVPFVFEAKVLVGDGGRQRERDCQVVLADGKIHVQANDDQNLVRVVPYDRVQSISYSRGRDPFWSAPKGPARVARAGGDVLGIFRGARNWISLRMKTGKPQFVVFRLGSEEQARRAIAALEERTGRGAAVVVEPREDDR